MQIPSQQNNGQNVFIQQNTFTIYLQKRTASGYPHAFLLSAINRSLAEQKQESDQSQKNASIHFLR